MAIHSARWLAWTNCQATARYKTEAAGAAHQAGAVASGGEDQAPGRDPEYGRQRAAERCLEARLAPQHPKRGHDSQSSCGAPGSAEPLPRGAVAAGVG